MLSLILCFCVLILFVLDNQTVIRGASGGLMLWYNNVVPVLLPFMLISGIIANQIKRRSVRTQDGAIGNTVLLGAGTTLFLGIFCGYPLGAKTAADFVKEGIYSPRIGNLLIPVCNNSSPMFIAGYIVHIILKDTVSFPFALLVLYTPYLLFLLLSLVFIHWKKKAELSGKKQKAAVDTAPSTPKNTCTPTQNYMQNAIIQITYVGIYIMLCSIIIEYIARLSFLTPMQTAILSGITEITNGTHLLSICAGINTHIKTALILAVTSFGGISAILQTNKVINGSGLSILFYLCAKIICAMGTFGMTMLLLV